MVKNKLFEIVDKYYECIYSIKSSSGEEMCYTDVVRELYRSGARIEVTEDNSKILKINIFNNSDFLASIFYNLSLYI